MEPEFNVGSRGAILLESVDGSRRVVAVVLRANADCRYELDLEAPIAEETEHPVMLSFGDGVEQRLAPVLETQREGTLLAVRTPSHWHRTSDRRARPRYPILVPCTMSVGEVCVPARCLDISLSGVAVETEFWHPPEFSLGIPYRGSTVRIACRTAAVQASGAVIVVHAEFLELSEPHPALTELI
ncbi:MAG: PilZ domain-containing protein, partial [Tepidiformaceae bacterium]